MHELSLAEEVIRIAGYEAGRNDAGRVSEITIEAGIFCGVEIDAFRSALEMLAEGTMLANAEINIQRIDGEGYCSECGREFNMNNRVDTCPVCNSFPSEIRRGYEFRVVSIVVEGNDDKE